MELLLLLVGAAIVLGIPVGVLLLWLGQSTLRRSLQIAEMRITSLEAGLSAMQAERTQLPAPEAVPLAVATPDAATVAVASEVPVAPVESPTGPWNVFEGAEPPPPPTGQDRPIVLNAERLAALTQWLRTNWVYAISAVSLALAGVFFVQYGMEKGLLPPAARVVLGIAFGVALVLAGEVIRRRSGDDEDASTSYLPSVFSGAGLVSVFAAIVAARQMYGLIGPEVTFAGLILTALAAVVLGWFHGPLLAAVGLIGAAASPFLVGGGAEAPNWLFGHYLLVAATGLAVDAQRRWAWISVLALALGYGGGWLVALGGGDVGGLIVLATALPLIATVLPVSQIVPSHDGPTCLRSALANGQGGWPSFPVRLVAGSALVSSLLLAVQPGNPAESLLAHAALVLLILAFTLWADRARGLHDLALLPAAGLLLRLLAEGANFAPLVQDFVTRAILSRPPETAPPFTVTILLGLAALASAGFANRALRGSEFPVLLGLASATVAPVAALIINLTMDPVAVLGAWLWALHVIALAAGMVALALAFARADAGDHRRAAHATLSALSLIALALFVVTTSAALTLALCVLVLVAAFLDRRFLLPEMGLFIQLGVAVIGFRLIVDPGLDWAFSANLPLVILTYVGPIVAFVGALILTAPLTRPMTRVALEAGVATVPAILADILLYRLIIDVYGMDGGAWGTTLLALPWLIVAFSQLYRARPDLPLMRLRQALAVLAAAPAALGLAVSVTVLNPLIDGTPVKGPMLLDTVFVAYALPALVLLAGWARLTHLSRRLRLSFLTLGAAFGALYVVLEIRRFWRGDDLSVYGTSQPELYSYTVALLLLGAVLLYQAIARKSDTLRRIAMAVIGLTIAKVFLVDVSGLTGLTRVFSFLALGLSLAGLAWLNRWAAGAHPAKADPS
ncbi:MAG: DUF2339 domain-containing protein [Pseudomonadota bacterium]